MRRLELFFALALSPVAIAFAQVDFTGAWDHPGLFGHEDFNDRGAGPEIGVAATKTFGSDDILVTEKATGKVRIIRDGEIVAVPAIFAFGAPTFEIAAIISMIIVVLVTMTETTADILAVGEIVRTKVDSRRIADGLRAGGTDATFLPLESPQGHDAFLVDFERFGPVVREFLGAL